MRPVTVLIFHPQAGPSAGPLGRALADARRALAERQVEAFLEAGADRAEIVEGPPDGRTFGERLVAARRTIPDGGLVVVGSGSLALAASADLRRFVDVAAGPPGRALANNRFSADAVAISRSADLAGLPPLPADNALPRWLEEAQGVAVADLRGQWRLGIDLDTPADVLVLEAAGVAPAALGGPGANPGLADGAGGATAFRERLASLQAVLCDRRAELLVAGRLSAATLLALEDATACRVRAFVEERGLRASSRLAQAGVSRPSRPPRSILGSLLERDGPRSLGRIVADLADGAVIDTRVLLAHRCGIAEGAWPAAEDRFASDLLLPGSIRDLWLRSLTEAALDAPISVLLGGHSLLNGGLRLLAGAAAAPSPGAGGHADD